MREESSEKSGIGTWMLVASMGIVAFIGAVIIVASSSANVHEPLWLKVVLVVVFTFSNFLMLGIIAGMLLAVARMWDGFCDWIDEFLGR